jgi:hypothetical protein
MTNSKLVAATLVAMTVAAVLVAPLGSVIASNTGTLGVAGNVGADVGNYQELDGYDITSNFTATDSDGNTLSEGADYELNRTDATIKFLSGSSLVTDGETITVEYEYEAASGTTTTVATLVPLFAGLLILGTAAVKMRKMM